MREPLFARVIGADRHAHWLHRRRGPTCGSLPRARAFVAATFIVMALGPARGARADEKVTCGCNARLVRRAVPAGTEVVCAKLKPTREYYPAGSDPCTIGEPEQKADGSYVVKGPYWLYYPSGKLQAAGRFLSDKLIGQFVEYYESGGKKRVVDADLGSVTEFYEDGVKRAEIEKSGYFRAWYKTGKLRVEGEGAEAQPRGSWSYYDEDGTRTTVNHQFSPAPTASYLRGAGHPRKTGEWNYWTDTGVLLKTETYGVDGLSGPFAEYHPNGQMKEQGTLCREPQIGSVADVGRFGQAPT